MTDPFDKHRPGIHRRVARILAMVGAGRVSAPAPVRKDRKVAVSATVGDLLEQANAALPPQPQREPRSMVLDSDDLLPPIKAPWIDRPPFDPWVNSSTFHLDDPEALRASGPQAVASALAGLAEWGAACGRKDVREVAAMLRMWLVEDAGRFDSLDRDLGLSPRDGSRPLSNIARRAERDELVLRLSRQKPYADMPARRAAQALRAACGAYESRRWPMDREERVSRPQGDNGVWWRVMNLGLPYAMPGEETLLRMIERDRGPDQTRLPLLS